MPTAAHRGLLRLDTARGNRPSFGGAAPPEVAELLVARVAETIRGPGVRVAEGRFGARMAVTLVNDGPVTIVLDVGPAGV